MKVSIAWWKNISISKKLYSIVGVMATLIVCELLVLQFAMGTLSAARALVGGESLWSKAQKNAAVSIQRYGVTRNESDYSSFLKYLEVPEGDHIARLELLKPNPDLATIRKGFIQGHIHPDDINPMIHLLRRFSRISYLAQAISMWGKADSLLAQFKTAGVSYHAALVSNNPGLATRSLERLKYLNERLTPLEDEFTFALGEGSRWLEYVVLAILSIAVLAVESVGISLTFLTARALSRGLRDLNNTALELGRGNFDTRTSQRSGDEIGTLASSLNMMGEMLQRSYGDLESRVRDRTAEVAQSRDQLNIVLNGITDGITVVDREGRIIYANDAGARMCGFDSVEEVLKTPREQFSEHFQLFKEDGGPFPWEELPSRRIFKGERNPPEVTLQTYSKKSDERVWTVLKSAPVFDESGELKFVVTISKDVTQAKRVEDAMKFLDEASRVLGSSLDYENVLQKLTELAVSKIADWCTIDVAEKDGQTPRRVAVAHPNPERGVLAEEWRTHYPTDWNAPTGAAAVFRSGKALLAADIPDAALVNLARDKRHLEMMRGLGIKSVMMVPLISRSKTLGVMTLVSAESGKRYRAHDLAFAEELARRAAVAIDNALLYKQAKLAIAARDEFMSIASHELKTPITSLSLQLQMARLGFQPDKPSPPSPEKIAKIFEIADRQVERLTGLIEDLLDASRIQTGKFSFSFENGDLTTLVTEMVSRFAPVFLKAGCKVETEIQEGITGFFDYGRIQQVMDNLLSNVAKYAPGVSVKILLKTWRGQAQIIVQDEGPGIPLERQPLVFERFERATSARNVSGMGLGLFIVKEIAKGHRGKVTLESGGKWKGSKFTVAFPLRFERHVMSEKIPVDRVPLPPAT